MPAWARVKRPLTGEADAVLAAGASLAAIDAFVRADAAFAGVWRQRLALCAAAGTARLLGRREDEAALRDAWCFGRPGDALGPAGSVLALWRQLVQRGLGQSDEGLASIARGLGIGLGGRAGDLAEILAQALSSQVLPLRAVTEASQAITALMPDGELLALVLADLVLAQRMHWPKPVPLLMTQIHNPILRSGEPRRRPRAGEAAWPGTLATAYALAAAEAVDLAGDLARRFERLEAVAPRLRAKGADKIVEALLAEDALTAASAPGSMSERALRRLFDRLTDLHAIRELSGRSTFRLYGL